LVSDRIDPRRIAHCDFQGDVVLGCFSGWIVTPDSVKLPTGVYHSTVVDCVIGDEALVRHVGMLSNYAVGKGAYLSNCGSIACTARTSFGNGQTLPLGIATGGRDLPVFVEITVPLASVLTANPGRQEYLTKYQYAIAEYMSRATSTRGIV